MRRLALLAVLTSFVAAPGCAMPEPGARTVRAIPAPVDSRPSDRMRGVSATHAVGPERCPVGQDVHEDSPGVGAKKKSAHAAHVFCPTEA